MSLSHTCCAVNIPLELQVKMSLTSLPWGPASGMKKKKSLPYTSWSLLSGCSEIRHLLSIVQRLLGTAHLYSHFGFPRSERDFQELS